MRTPTCWFMGWPLVGRSLKAEIWRGLAYYFGVFHEYPLNVVVNPDQTDAEEVSQRIGLMVGQEPFVPQNEIWFVFPFTGTPQINIAEHHCMVMQNGGCYPPNMVQNGNQDRL